MQVLGGSLQRRALRATDTYWTPAVKGSQCQLAEKLPHRMLCRDLCSSLILNLEIYFWTWIVCIFQGLVTTGQGQQASSGEFQINFLQYLSMISHDYFLEGRSTFCFCGTCSSSRASCSRTGGNSRHRRRLQSSFESLEQSVHFWNRQSNSWWLCTTCYWRCQRWGHECHSSIALALQSFNHAVPFQLIRYGWAWKGVPDSKTNSARFKAPSKWILRSFHPLHTSEPFEWLNFKLFRGLDSLLRVWGVSVMAKVWRASKAEASKKHKRVQALFRGSTRQISRGLQKN